MIRAAASGTLMALLALTSANACAQTDPFKIDELMQMTLNELLELEVITPSRVEQRLIDAAANITVVTQAMIRRRGYKNLVEILQDLPGFDFATYEDGGGEYTNHALNRGIGGGPGNPKLLILLDGVAQNHIGFNWSQLFGEEQLYQDLDRIEVIQGPVSAVYGANAFSGIVHFITRREVKAEKASSTVWLGEDNTRLWSAQYRNRIDNIHLGGAFKLYRTDGDMGLDRPDPGSYFHNNHYPDITTANYDGNGEHTVNTPHPYAGQALADGFNTHKDNWSFRGNINYFNPKADTKKGLMKATASLFVWNKEEGLASYVPGFEYLSTDPSFKMHHSAQMYAADMDYRFNENLLATTSAWYRQNRQLPQTGFKYTYRYPDLIKSYHSLNTTWGVEQQFKWTLGEDLLLIGGRYMASDKMDQVVSLGQFQEGHDPVTTSSWSLATGGDNPMLGQSQRVQVYKPKEEALYATYDGRFNDNLSYTAGLRLDHSDDYGSTTNPRLGLVWRIPNKTLRHWNVKLLYGEAFREPSIFELTDEFRGNRNLTPEEIKTTELVSQMNWQPLKPGVIKSWSINSSLFHSQMRNLITLVQSDQTESGSVYANDSSASVRGLSLTFDARLVDQWAVFVNYQYTEGNQHGDWRAVDNTARHKWNLGFNWKVLDDKLNINWRTNVLSKRKVPASNGYFDHYAPGYEKSSLTLTWQDWMVGPLRLSPQLVIKNLFDEDYVGVGRQDGRSDRSEFHPQLNPNPEGFVPGYHPQPGRTILFNVKIDW